MESGDLNSLATKAKGDKPSLDQLCKEFQSRLVGMVRQARIHRNDQPDAVQEILMLLMKCVSKYDPVQGNFENYFLHSVSKYLITIRSREGKYHDRNTFESDVPVMAEAVTKEFVPTTIPDEFSILTAHQKDLVQDHYGINRPRPYSINQIAARRGMTNEKVRATLKEALRRMGK